MELFGFSIKRKQDENKNIPSFVRPNVEDGSVNIAATGTGVSSVLDMDGTAKSETELVQKYRTMLQQPEVFQAFDDIVNEAICITATRKSLNVLLMILTSQTALRRRLGKSLRRC
jgi:hypothetical protein